MAWHGYLLIELVLGKELSRPKQSLSPKQRRRREIKFKNALKALQSANVYSPSEFVHIRWNKYENAVIVEARWVTSLISSNFFESLFVSLEDVSFNWAKTRVVFFGLTDDDGFRLETSGLPIGRKSLDVKLQAALQKDSTYETSRLDCLNYISQSLSEWGYEDV